MPRLRRFAEYSGRNPHGWGIAYYRDSEAVVRKLPEKALNSKTYFQTAEEAEGNIIISHIRHASRGKLHERNCHPFRYTMDGRDWVFAHNGHVDGIGPHPRARGETDSESVFHMLIDHIRGVDDIMAGLRRGVTSLFEDYEFGRQIRLNFLLSNGDRLFAFSHHQEKPVYCLNGVNSSGCRTQQVSTRAKDGFPWERMPEDRLFEISHGKIDAISGPI